MKEHNETARAHRGARGGSGTMSDLIDFYTEFNTSLSIDVEPADLLAVESKLPKSKLTIVPTPGFYITFPKAKPNWWFRFWQRLLLGWVWESVDEVPQRSDGA